MQFLPLDQIQVAPERQRVFFDPDKLAELQRSIETLGLLQPLVVRNGNQLVCGERRLKVLQGISLMGGTISFGGKVVPADHAPCLDIGELSEADAFEAELDENIRRQDLTWQEHAEAIRKLHSLRTAQTPTHTVKQTAEEVHGRGDGYFQESVRKQLIVANHLSRPEVAKAKSVDEAFKILKRDERAKENVARGKAAAALSTNDRHLLLKGNSIEWMQDYAGPGFDCIITDPPYGMGADSFGNAGGSQSATHQYSDDLISTRTLLADFAALSFLITKPEAHAYVWCDIDSFEFLRGEMAAAGWHVHRTPIVYLKPDGNRVPWPKVGLQRKWELVLFAEKGGKPLNTVVGDYFQATGDDNLGHGAQKPVAAYAELLKRSTRPGDTVLDPFAGTGTLLPAAHAVGCNATLIEQSEEYFGIIASRMEALA